jgi:hypothetical protein
MRLASSPGLLALPLALLALPGCPPSCDTQGEYERGIADDAGPGGGGGVPLSSIGTACRYFYDGVNPTNDCPVGTECLIVTGDAAYTSNLQLPAWEDQFTLYLGDHDEGYCTLVGTTAAPPTCPAGSVLKVFTTNITACLRTCQSPADCSRPGYTCDRRYLDVDPPLCMKQCSFDVPDCVRSGVFADPQNPTTLFPALSFEDMTGASTCVVDDGICGAVATHGTKGPGEACFQTSECAAGSVCIQGPVVAAVLQRDPPVDANGPGFCASPCTPVAQGEDPRSNCSLGYVCQEAGNLTLNFPGMIVLASNGGVDSRGGYCFHQCQAGLEGACGPFPGTVCGDIDDAVGAPWNQVSMCLPPAMTP